LHLLCEDDVLNGQLLNSIKVNNGSQFEAAYSYSDSKKPSPNSQNSPFDKSGIPTVENVMPIIR